MAIAFDVSTVATAYTSTGTQTTSHAGSSTARAAVVLIDQNASTADQVSGVTYGGVSMVRLRSDTESTETGRVYVYWLDDVAHGTQNVAMTTSGTANKQLTVATMTVSTGKRVSIAGNASGTSTSSANPAWTITGLTSSSVLEAFEVIHSGLDTMTTTVPTGWTRISSTDLGTQGRGFAWQHVASSGTTLACGWTASTADDFVGSSVAFIEANQYSPVGLVYGATFAEGSGTTFADVSGRGHSGSLASGATWVPGHSDSALVGSTGQAGSVVATSIADFTNAAGISIECWINPGAGAGNYFLGGFTDSGRSADKFGIQLATLKPSLYLSPTANTGTDSIASNETLTANEWSHLAITWSAVSNTLRLYINGVAAGTSTLIAPYVGWALGALDIGGIDAWSTGAGGTVDDLRIWDAERTAAQISVDMATPPAWTIPTPHFPTTISSNGHYLLDENADPYLLTMDAGWELSAIDPTLRETYMASRAERGFNGFYVKAVRDGLTNNFNGVAPFTSGNFAAPVTAWWTDFDAMLDLAATYGLTALPLIFSTFEASNPYFNSTDAQCYAFGQWVGARWKDRPNLVYLMGGDWGHGHTSTEAGKCVQFILGLRNAGDTHFVAFHEEHESIGLYDSTLAAYADLAAPYVYYATYYQTRLGYASGKPSALIEADYDNSSGLDADIDTIRRQTLWTLTTGNMGYAYGEQHVWQMTSDWRIWLHTTSNSQLKALDAFWRSLDWQSLVPDTANVFITSGRGTERTTSVVEAPMDNDFATAAISADKSLAVCYIPTSRAFTLDMTQVGASPTVTAIDPTTLATTSLGTSGTYSALGNNASGTGDWIVQIAATATGTTISGTVAVVAGASGTVARSAASGTVAATAGTQGTVARSATAGTVTATSAAAGTLARSTAAGTVAAIAGAQGTLVRSTVAGTTATTSSVAGTLPVSQTSGVAASGSATAGTVDRSTISGVTPAVSGVTGAVSRSTLSGTAVATSAVAGALTISTIAGTTAATSAITGALALGSIAGTVAAVSATSGTVAPAAIAGIAGTITVTSGTTGTVACSQVAGVVTAASGAAGTVSLSQVVGTVAALTGLSGVVSLSQAAGAIAALVALVGALPRSQASGVVTVTSTVAGTVAVDPGTRHDVTVTGQLDPRRWAASLPDRTKTGALTPRARTGTLTDRTKTGTLDPRRWEGTT